MDDDAEVEIVKEFPAKENPEMYDDSMEVESFPFIVTPLMARYSRSVLQRFARWIEEKEAQEEECAEVVEAHYTADSDEPVEAPPINLHDPVDVQTRDDERAEAGDRVIAEHDIDSFSTVATDTAEPSSGHAIVNEKSEEDKDENIQDGDEGEEVKKIQHIVPPTRLMKKITKDGNVEYQVKNKCGNIENPEHKEEEEEDGEWEEGRQWVVKKVLDKRIKQDGNLEYLLKWKGYVQPSWEIESNCACAELIEEFERKEAKKRKRRALSKRQAEPRNKTSRTE